MSVSPSEKILYAQPTGVCYPLHLASMPTFRLAILPQLERRLHTDRRARMKAMPLVQPPWPRRVVVAGCLGVFLGSAGAMAVLSQRAALSPSPPAIAGTARQDAPVSSYGLQMNNATATPAGPPTAGGSPLAAEAEPIAGAGPESYSEDAASVPSARYYEPPALQRAASGQTVNAGR